jgi:DNA-binding XRE family transcriptional regulator
MKGRIEKIIKDSSMNPSEFAKHIGVSAPSISHILTGRNQPSLVIVTKILDKFTTINMDWLLFGRGQMYKTADNTTNDIHTSATKQPSLFDQKQPEIKNIVYHEVKPPANESKPPVIEQLPQQIQAQKKITKIMIFYSDNTFDSLSPDF